jgi:hypothetical protein
VTIKPGRFNYDIAKSHLQSADCRKVFWVGKKKIDERVVVFAVWAINGNDIRLCCSQRRGRSIRVSVDLNAPTSVTVILALAPRRDDCSVSGSVKSRTALLDIGQFPRTSRMTVS